MKTSFNYGSRRRKVIVILMALLYFITTVGLNVINKNGQIMIAGSASLAGILSAMQFGIALFMVAIEYELGGKLAVILIAISSCALMLTMFARHSFESLPGFCNYAVCLVAIFFIRNKIAKERRNALIDDMTGLGNRNHLIQYIGHLLSLKNPFYVILLDLNNFKIVNDMQGHKKGDELIVELTNEWKQIESKNTYLGRFGGDEFIVVVKKNKCPDVEGLTEKYIDVVRRVADRDESLYSYLTVSAGIVEYPVNATKVDDLLRKADITVNKVKKEGRNLQAMYYDSFEEEIVREQQIEGSVKKALEKGLLYMVYQPQFYADSKKLRGFESLVRMSGDGQNPAYGPAEFIPVAEKSDLIIEIGEYVLKSVTSDFAKLVDANKDLTISVNISAKQILSRNFVSCIKKILDDTGFNPSNLELEITEYCFVDSVDEAVAVINELKKLGMKIAMDDFGTGYSSMSYLTKLPIDVLKIDKSIVDEIGTGEIVGAICSMSHALNCEIVAEGVEEQYQLGILNDKGCDIIQGYIWGRPMDYIDAISLM